MPMLSAPSDEVLVEEAQIGVLEAFEVLYERYFHNVYNRVRYLVPEQDVDDVTQEIFIAVMRSLKSFRGESLFSTWLWTLTSRQVADYYRRERSTQRQIQTDINELDSSLNITTREDKNNVSIDERITLRQSLNHLPEKYKSILLHRFADGMRFHEIAHYQGQSLEATKSLFRRAIAALSKQMEETNE